MRLPSLEDIKKRKVVQWCVGYLGGAWVVLEAASVLGDTYGWPAGLMRALPVVLGAGAIATLVLAWYHGERGAQRMTGAELVVLATLLVATGGVVRVVVGGSGSDDASMGVPEGAGPADQSLESTAVAVLPFEAIGGDPVFAAGLTDELQRTLSLVPTLRVTARTSAGAFAGLNLPADSIGRALGVAHLIEGTVRAAGDEMRVSVRLVATDTGIQEWSGSYDRVRANILATQEEIARAVAVQLRQEVGIAGHLRGTPLDPEVFSLVARARQLVATMGEHRGSRMDEAKRMYEEAIARDSTYAPAWAGLARLRIALVIGDLAPDAGAELELASADAMRALTLDPNEGLAHQVLGRRASDYPTQALHYERAISANPADSESMGLLAMTMLNQGDEVGALRLADLSIELDPLADDPLYTAAYVYSSTGRHEHAIELGRRMVALVPNKLGKIAGLANFLAAAGESAEAAELAREVVDAAPEWQHGRDILAFAYAQGGDRSAAERVLSGGRPSHSTRAAVEAALGDRDAAFAALEESIAGGEPSSRQLHTDNWLHSLRDDDRWDPLVDGVGAS